MQFATMSESERAPSFVLPASWLDEEGRLCYSAHILESIPEESEPASSYASSRCTSFDRRLSSSDAWRQNYGEQPRPSVRLVPEPLASSGAHLDALARSAASSGDAEAAPSRTDGEQPAPRLGSIRAAEDDYDAHPSAGEEDRASDARGLAGRDADDGRAPASLERRTEAAPLSSPGRNSGGETTGASAEPCLPQAWRETHAGPRTTAATGRGSDSPGGAHLRSEREQRKTKDARERGGGQRDAAPDGRTRGAQLGREKETEGSQAAPEAEAGDHADRGADAGAGEARRLESESSLFPGRWQREKAGSGQQPQDIFLGEKTSVREPPWAGSAGFEPHADASDEAAPLYRSGDSRAIRARPASLSPSRKREAALQTDNNNALTALSAVSPCPPLSAAWSLSPPFSCRTASSCDGSLSPSSAAVYENDKEGDLSACSFSSLSSSSSSLTSADRAVGARKDLPRSPYELPCAETQRAGCEADPEASTGREEVTPARRGKAEDAGGTEKNPPESMAAERERENGELRCARRVADQKNAQGFALAVRSVEAAGRREGVMVSNAQPFEAAAEALSSVDRCLSCSPSPLPFLLWVAHCLGGLSRFLDFRDTLALSASSFALRLLICGSSSSLASPAASRATPASSAAVSPSRSPGRDEAREQEQTGGETEREKKERLFMSVLTAEDAEGAARKGRAAASPAASESLRLRRSSAQASHREATPAGSQAGEGRTAEEGSDQKEAGAEGARRESAAGEVAVENEWRSFLQFIEKRTASDVRYELEEGGLKLPQTFSPQASFSHIRVAASWAALPANLVKAIFARATRLAHLEICIRRESFLRLRSGAASSSCRPASASLPSRSPLPSSPASLVDRLVAILEGAFSCFVASRHTIESFSLQIQGEDTNSLFSSVLPQSPPLLPSLHSSSVPTFLAASSSPVSAAGSLPPPPSGPLASPLTSFLPRPLRPLPVSPFCSSLQGSTSVSTRSPISLCPESGAGQKRGRGGATEAGRELCFPRLLAFSIRGSFALFLFLFYSVSHASPCLCKRTSHVGASKEARVRVARERKKRHLSAEEAVLTPGGHPWKGEERRLRGAHGDDSEEGDAGNAEEKNQPDRELERVRISFLWALRSWLDDEAREREGGVTDAPPNEGEKEEEARRGQRGLLVGEREREKPHAGAEDKQQRAGCVVMAAPALSHFEVSDRSPWFDAAVFLPFLVYHAQRANGAKSRDMPSSSPPSSYEQCGARSRSRLASSGAAEVLACLRHQTSVSFFLVKYLLSSCSSSLQSLTLDFLSPALLWHRHLSAVRSLSSSSSVSTPSAFRLSVSSLLPCRPSVTPARGEKLAGGEGDVHEEGTVELGGTLSAQLLLSDRAQAALASSASSDLPPRVFSTSSFCDPAPRGGSAGSSARSGGAGGRQCRTQTSEDAGKGDDKGGREDEGGRLQRENADGGFQTIEDCYEGAEGAEGHVHSPYLPAYLSLLSFILSPSASRVSSSSSLSSLSFPCLVQLALGDAVAAGAALALSCSPRSSSLAPPSSPCPSALSRSASVSSSGGRREAGRKQGQESAAWSERLPALREIAFLSPFCLFDTDAVAGAVAGENAAAGAESGRDGRALADPQLERSAAASPPPLSSCQEPSPLDFLCPLLKSWMNGERGREVEARWLSCFSLVLLDPYTPLASPSIQDFLQLCAPSLRHLVLRFPPATSSASSARLSWSSPSSRDSSACGVQRIPLHLARRRFAFSSAPPSAPTGLLWQSAAAEETPRTCRERKRRPGLSLGSNPDWTPATGRERRSSASHTLSVHFAFLNLLSLQVMNFNPLLHSILSEASFAWRGEAPHSSSSSPSSPSSAILRFSPHLPPSRLPSPRSFRSSSSSLACTPSSLFSCREPPLVLSLLWEGEEGEDEAAGSEGESDRSLCGGSGRWEEGGRRHRQDLAYWKGLHEYLDVCSGLRTYRRFGTELIHSFVAKLPRFSLVLPPSTVQTARTLALLFSPATSSLFSSQLCRHRAAGLILPLFVDAAPASGVGAASGLVGPSASASSLSKSLSSSKEADSDPRWRGAAAGSLEADSERSAFSDPALRSSPSGSRPFFGSERGSEAFSCLSLSATEAGRFAGLLRLLTAAALVEHGVWSPLDALELSQRSRWARLRGGSEGRAAASAPPSPERAREVEGTCEASAAWAEFRQPAAADASPYRGGDLVPPRSPRCWVSSFVALSCPPALLTSGRGDAPERKGERVSLARSRSRNMETMRQFRKEEIGLKPTALSLRFLSQQLDGVGWEGSLRRERFLDEEENRDDGPRGDGGAESREGAGGSERREALAAPKRRRRTLFEQRLQKAELLLGPLQPGDANDRRAQGGSPNGSGFPEQSPRRGRRREGDENRDEAARQRDARRLLVSERAQTHARGSRRGRAAATSRSLVSPRPLASHSALAKRRQGAADSEEEGARSWRLGSLSFLKLPTRGRAWRLGGDERETNTETSDDVPAEVQRRRRDGLGRQRDAAGRASSEETRDSSSSRSNSRSRLSHSALPVDHLASSISNAFAGLRRSASSLFHGRRGTEHLPGSGEERDGAETATTLPGRRGRDADEETLLNSWKPFFFSPRGRGEPEKQAATWLRGGGPNSTKTRLKRSGRLLNRLHPFVNVEALEILLVPQPQFSSCPPSACASSHLGEEARAICCRFFASRSLCRTAFIRVLRFTLPRLRFVLCSLAASSLSCFHSPSSVIASASPACPSPSTPPSDERAQWRVQRKRIEEESRFAFLLRALGFAEDTRVSGENSGEPEEAFFSLPPPREWELGKGEEALTAVGVFSSASFLALDRKAGADEECRPPALPRFFTAQPLICVARVSPSSPRFSAGAQDEELSPDSFSSSSVPSSAVRLASESSDPLSPPRLARLSSSVPLVASSWLSPSPRGGSVARVSASSSSFHPLGRLPSAACVAYSHLAPELINASLGRTSLLYRRVLLPLLRSRYTLALAVARAEVWRRGVVLAIRDIAPFLPRAEQTRSASQQVRVAVMAALDVILDEIEGSPTQTPGEAERDAEGRAHARQESGAATGDTRRRATEGRRARREKPESGQGRAAGRRGREKEA
ncbi:hypothetical protein BESB_054640 [Besnoitia besnoiti]|uniref:Uncharacterized protein n=1 Tax=Besnoitia besnoiti TaxID=94643 RepID=A0A2A9MJI2_BESBE|nr:hypothetical protein BESB_054640 [Besnoitia besnoiti]PFH35813.1 hypothetical protein BESB_054640 [Besnoitia besnoiti]